MPRRDNGTREVSGDARTPTGRAARVLITAGQRRLGAARNPTTDLQRLVMVEM
jgi:hypothetical protein